MEQSRSFHPHNEPRGQRHSHPLSCSAWPGDCVPKEASPSPRGDLPKSKREILSICRASRKLSRFHKHHICIQCALRLYLTWQEILVFRTSVFQSAESSLQTAPQLCISKCPKDNGGKTGVKTMASKLTCSRSLEENPFHLQRFR